VGLLFGVICVYVDGFLDKRCGGDFWVVGLWLLGSWNYVVENVGASGCLRRCMY
jgi:hypothetical protein